MSKIKEIDTKLVKSVNKKVVKLSILKSIVGKKVDIAMRDLIFRQKNIKI